jgi:outer membrane receptor protein involved in Fe transport
MKTDTTRFKKSVVVRALLTAFCGTATMMVATGVAAQTPAPGLQRVEITGSNIRRADVETAAPVQTFTREDIVNSGKGSVAEFLQTLTVDNQGSVPTTFGNGFASGASGISLRGLGVASTLVLINGRRIAPYGLADDGQKIFADLNVIPLEAVERVEILKDGGSAIYGSDAIAGVVNVILRKSYQGTVATASYGASSYHDGAETRASITHGFGDMEEKGFNVLLNLELSSKNAIWNRDRNDRGAVGKGDGRPFGYDAQGGGGTIGGGTGAILQPEHPQLLQPYPAERGRLHQDFPRRRLRHAVWRLCPRRSGLCRWPGLPDRWSAQLQPDPAAGAQRQFLCPRCQATERNDRGVCRTEPVQRQERILHDAIRHQRFGRLPGRSGQQCRGRSRRQPS